MNPNEITLLGQVEIERVFAMYDQGRAREREEIASLVEAHGCRCKSWRYPNPSSRHDAWCPVALAAAIRGRG